MNANSSRNIFSLVVLASLLGACGGGGDDSTAVACAAGVAGLNPAFCAPNPNGVTVAATQAPAPLALAPASLTIGNCTTRVPFLFSGGVGPYTIFTSDNFNVPVSTALSLGDGRQFFFADVHYQGFTHDPEIAVLTVLDSQAKTVIATISTPVKDAPPSCPTNPLLKVLPETANFRVSEILAFQVSGGPVPLGSLSFACDVTNVGCVDDPVIRVVDQTGSAVNVQARAPGTKLLTIGSSDGQRVSVVINVLPQP